MKPSLLAAMVAAAALLLGACANTNEPVDCDQRLGDGDYDAVLAGCDNAFQRASAHLGKAGFNMVKLIQSQAEGDAEVTGSVAVLLDLQPDTVTDVRNELIAAIEEVRSPQSGNQAFALLMASFLGMGTTVAEYLDNGSGGATALDDQYDDAEISEATGLSESQGAELQFLPAATPYFQVVTGGKPHTIICADVSVTICNNIPFGSVFVFDDLDGAAKLDTNNLPDLSADISFVVPFLKQAEDANLVVQLTGLQFPVEVDDAKTARMQNFLGDGDPEQEFAIGITGYLDLLDIANNNLSGSSEGGIEAVSNQIDAIRNRLDNGGDCLAQSDAQGAGLLDLLYVVYFTAVGTQANPAPNHTDFTENNIAPYEYLAAAGVPFPEGFEPAAFVFPDYYGFKFLFPAVQPLDSFDLANAVARVDAADPDFQAEFENVPLLAPGAAPADDGEVSYAELFCFNSVSEESGDSGDSGDSGGSGGSGGS